MEHFLTSFVFDYLNRNISFAIFFLLIIFARLALNRFPKKYSYVLWLILGIKAVFNTGFLSVAGIASKLIPKSEEGKTAASGIIGKAVTTPVQAGTVVSEILSETSKSPEKSYLFIIAFAIWAIGFFVLLFIGIKGYTDLKKKVSLSFSDKKGIRVCDYIDSPMVFGIFKPAIYVPSGIDTSELEYVIKHEKIHLKRKDPLIKLCAFVILAFYWMNPFAWLAFKLINLDMELSCDEAVLEKENAGVREVYGKWLVFFATNGRSFGPFPTAFGETNVERRVKNMGKKKSFTFIACGIAMLIVVLFAVVCLFKAPKVVATGADETVNTLEDITEDNAQVQADDESLTDESVPADPEPAEEVSADPEPAQEAVAEPAQEDAAEPTPATDVGVSADTVWLWPLEGEFYISRAFGATNIISGDATNEETQEGHPGVDIPAPIGTPVLAARTGIVEFAGWESMENGNVVIIKADDNTSVKYAHMDSVSVNTGDSVSQGDSVGTVGSTGASTGPHLCFMVITDAGFVDPMQFYTVE